MPRTKPGTRANRSCASRDQAGRGPFPFPVSPFPSSKASSRPVVTIPLTVSSGCESIVVPPIFTPRDARSEEHTSELQSRLHLVCRLLLEKKKKKEKN